MAAEPHLESLIDVIVELTVRELLAECEVVPSGDQPPAQDAEDKS